MKLNPGDPCNEMDLTCLSCPMLFTSDPSEFMSIHEARIGLS